MVYFYCQYNEITVFRVGKQYRFRREDLEEYINHCLE
ncbi:MAG: hypothetical protein ACLU78_08605 [Clostridium sp.]